MAIDSSLAFASLSLVNPLNFLSFWANRFSFSSSHSIFISICNIGWSSGRTYHGEWSTGAPACYSSS